MFRLQEDTTVFTSSIGHKNFHYPSERELSLEAGARLSPLPWIGGGGLRAFLCLGKVVWVDPGKLPKEG
jgi:hypothetical protein